MPPKKKKTGKSYSEAEFAAAISRAVAEALAAQSSRQHPRRSADTVNTTPSTPPVKPCSYKDFLSCQPLYFNGTEGAIGLIRWIERMESVFNLCSCTEDNKVKFAAYTFQEGALSWWNTYANSVGLGIANQLPWAELKEKLTDKYCPEEELHRLEEEFWHLKVQGTDIASYTSKFQQFALLCPGLVEPERKGIKRYIRGLPESIQGNVASSKPTTTESAIRLAHELMALVVNREGPSTASSYKRKLDENSNQQPQTNKKPTDSEYSQTYKGSKPYCSKCNLHHDGTCPCTNCRRFGHLAKDCRTAITGTNASTPGTCYECNETGHLRKDCPKRKNKGNNTRGNAYVLNAGDDEDPRLCDLLNSGMFIPTPSIPFCTTKFPRIANTTMCLLFVLDSKYTIGIRKTTD